MQTSSRITLNTASSWLTLLVNGAIGVVLVPFLLNQFGKAGYGLVALAGVVVSITMMLDMGLGGALGRQLAAAQAEKDDDHFNEFISTAMFLYLGLGTVVALVCVGVAPLIASAFNLPAELLDEGIFLVRWYASAAVLLTFLSIPFSSVLISENRFDRLNMINLGGGVLKAGLLFSVLTLTDLRLYGWAICMIASQASVFLVTRRSAIRMKPTMRIRVSLVRKDATRSLFSLGGYLFTLRTVGRLSVSSDPIVLTTILGPASVALYSPAIMLSGMAKSLVDGLSSQLHPLATSYHVTGQNKQLQQVLIRGTRYTLLLGILACVVLAVFAEPICSVWLSKILGQDYLITALVLVLWTGVDLSMYAAGSQWPVLLGVNRLRFLVWTQIPLAVANLIASILLVKYTSLGVIGVIIPTLVIGIIRRPIIIVHTARVIKLPVRRYLAEAYARPAMVLCILVVFAFALKIALQPRDIVRLSVSIGAMFLIWLPTVWWIGFGRNDRESFRALASRGLARIGRNGRDGKKVAIGGTQGTDLHDDE